MSANSLTTSFDTLTETHAILYAWEGDVEISTDETPVAGSGFILKQGEFVEVNATQISARAVRGTAALSATAVLSADATPETPADNTPDEET